MMDGVHIGTSVWSSDYWGGPFCPNKFTDPLLCRGSVNLDKWYVFRGQVIRAACPTLS